MRLDVREREHQVVAELVDALGKFPGELFVGGREREFGARVNQIGNSLGLRQINATIQKCTLGEFARLGEPRAVGEQRVEHKLGGQQSAMAGNLDGVLARERARRAQDGEQHFVNHFFTSDNFAELNGVRRRGGWFQRTFADRLKTFAGDGERLRAGKPDDGQPAFAERRGDGGNGVVEHTRRLQVEG